MTDKQLRERDTKRDLSAELLQSIREMKTREGQVVDEIDVPPVVMARVKSGLSQSEFAGLLGVSVRTLQDWEQGRRQSPKQRQLSATAKSVAPRPASYQTFSSAHRRCPKVGQF